MSVEGHDLDVLYGLGLEAVDVDREAVGVRARDVERLDPADRAERVLGDASVETVGRELPCAGEKSKPRGGHDEMKEAALGADRAVADGGLKSGRCRG